MSAQLSLTAKRRKKTFTPSIRPVKPCNDDDKKRGKEGVRTSVDEKLALL